MSYPPHPPWLYNSNYTWRIGNNRIWKSSIIIANRLRSGWWEDEELIPSWDRNYSLFSCFQICSGAHPLDTGTPSMGTKQLGHEPHHCPQSNADIKIARRITTNFSWFHGYFCNRPWRPVGLWDIKNFILCRQLTNGSEVVRLMYWLCSAPQKHFICLWYSYLFEAE
jgi:hypothetical protein